jgi:hypothetical protein
MQRIRLVALACVVMAAWPALARAQATDQTPEQQARVHFGPLSFTPGILISNVGVDSNATNDPVTPTQDFTATVGPGVNAWFRYGRLLLTDKTTFEWLYFKKLTKQRAANLTQNERVDFAMAYFTPHVEMDYARSRQRPTLDLDARVRRITKNVVGGVDIHLGVRATLDVAAQEQHDEADHDEFDGIDLGDQLTRDTSKKSLTFERALTPLTTFQLDASTQKVRFPFAGRRNNDSNAVMVGFKMNPLALISGNVAVGVRVFNSLDPLVPDYTGLIGRADTTYVLNDMTQFKAEFSRDVDYSFDPQSPYFLSTLGGLTVTQSLGQFWDVRGRAVHSSLAYRTFLDGVGLDGSPHTDSGDDIGVGLGRHLINGIRIGVDVDHVQRRSAISNRQFGGFRMGGSFTYGGS